MRHLRKLGVVKQWLLILPLAMGVLFAILLPTLVHAQTQTDDGFSLQVTPSPLVATIKPGMSTTLEMNIRNTSTKVQKLQMGLRTFTINETSGQVALGTEPPSEVKDF